MSIDKRVIATSDVRLSAITFGSMRMHERAVDDQHWQRLLAASLELGISSCHSSDEYESFPIFRRILEQLRVDGLASRLQHIVKLADPHFGEFTFEPARLQQRVDNYLNKLGVERLDVVQWMWRGDLKREAERLMGFQEHREVIESAFSELKKQGKVGSVLPFPYTQAFAERALTQPWCAGLALYVNHLELDSLPLAESAARSNRSVIALRPFAAGRVLQAGHAVADALRWTLSQPAVVTGVVSYSSMEHLEQLTA